MALHETKSFKQHAHDFLSALSVEAVNPLAATADVMTVD